MSKKVDIDERICDVSPTEKGVCGYKLYSFIQGEFAPEKYASLITSETPTGLRTVHVKMDGISATELEVPAYVTVAELNFLSKEKLGINLPLSWADLLDGAFVCWWTPWE